MNNTKTFVVVVVALLAIAAASYLIFVPKASALTLDQAQAELAGMHCSGSLCTQDIQDVIVRDLPDTVIINTTNIGSGANVTDSCGPWDNTIMVGGKPFCVFVGVNSNYSTNRRVVDGGTELVTTCTTITKELVYNGPYTDRAGAWSVNTSSSAREGAC